MVLYGHLETHLPCFGLSIIGGTIGNNSGECWNRITGIYLSIMSASLVSVHAILEYVHEKNIYIWWGKTSYIGIPGQRCFELINPRRAFAARVTVVVLCVCVCVSVKSKLTSGASVGPANTVTYSAGNGGQKNLWGFLWNRSVQELWCETQAKEPMC